MEEENVGIITQVLAGEPVSLVLLKSFSFRSQLQLSDK